MLQLKSLEMGLKELKMLGKIGSESKALNRSPSRNHLSWPLYDGQKDKGFFPLM